MTALAHSRTALLESIASTKELARFEFHLLSMDARQRWGEMEAKLIQFEQRLAREGEGVTDEVSQGVRNLNHAVRDFLVTHRKCEELNLPVTAVMTSDPETCLPTDTLERALRIMWEKDCGLVPVVSSSGQIEGVITDRDIAMACYTRGQSPRESSVDSAMTRELWCCTPGQTLGDALRSMSRARVRRLPVATAQGQLLGVLSLTDIVRRIDGSLGAANAACHTLAAIGEPRLKSLAAQ